MSAIKLQVEKREEIGKNKNKKMRKDGVVPGVLYSKEGAMSVKTDSRDFDKAFKAAGTSTIVDLEIAGEIVPSLIKEVQKHPYKNQYLHVDFQKLNMNEAVKLTVPIVLVGKENIDVQTSVLMQLLDTIDIACLPGHIPEAAEVDVSNIDFNTPVYVSDLNIYGDENITILREPDELIATLVTASKEEEDIEEEETMAADEVPIIGDDERE